MRRSAFLLLFLLALCARAQEWKVVEHGFLYTKPVPPTCHAASLVEDGDGLLAVFHGGSNRGHPDSNIWLSRYNAKRKRWSAPRLVADGVYTKHTRRAFEYDLQFGDIINRDTLFAASKNLKPTKHNGKPIINERVRKACYNPVIYRAQDGELVLNYRMGSRTWDWTGWEIRSADHGKTWTAPLPLTYESDLRHLQLGPIKNKPLINGGRIIAGSSFEEQNNCAVHFETSDDDGKTWEIRTVDKQDLQCIQPTILHLGGNHLKALCRTCNRFIAETESLDNGTTWSPMKLTALKNNNSGIDAVTLADGTHLLVCNDTKDDRRRSPLTLFASADAQQWTKLLDLEEDDGEEYAYPAIIQSSDGDVWVLYTWRGTRIAYTRLRCQNQ